MTTPVANRAEADILRQCLERVVPQICGGQSRIAYICRSRSPYSSFYGADILDVRLSTGEELKIFLKDFGSYQNPKDGMTRRREREMRVYRDLLAGAPLGTAVYYGSAWDESEGRFWLLLEFVSGTPVRYAAFECWALAAAWLGRLQGYFARDSRRFNACELLIRHDAGFFWSKAELALDAVSQISAPLAGRLGKIVGHYGVAVQEMAAQPATFVHGSYTPTQILFERERLRICPIDWELAGLGSPVYDLAILADGFEPPRLHQLWDAYGEEAVKHGISLPGREELGRVSDCFRLHRIMNRLGKSVEKQYAEKDIARLIAAGERLSGKVFRMTKDE